MGTIVLQNIYNGMYVKSIDQFHYDENNFARYSINETTDKSSALAYVINDDSLYGSRQILLDDLYNIVEIISFDALIKNNYMEWFPYITIDINTDDIVESPVKERRVILKGALCGYIFSIPQIMRDFIRKPFNIVLSLRDEIHENIEVQECLLNTFVLADDMDVSVARMLLDPNDILIESVVLQERLDKINNMSFIYTKNHYKKVKQLLKDISQ